MGTRLIEESVRQLDLAVIVSYSTPFRLVVVASNLFLAALYPLSAGPAMWAREHHYISNRAFARLYLPLFSFCTDASEPVSDVLMWSFNFNTPMPPAKARVTFSFVLRDPGSD